MERKEISRRDFLKISAYSSAAALRGSSSLHEHSEEDSTSNVRFNFRNHLLTPSEVDDNVDVILGETGLQDISMWHASYYEFLNSMPPRNITSDLTSKLLRPQVSASYNEILGHVRSVTQAKSLGKQLVATDSKHITSLDDKWFAEHVFDVYTLGYQRSAAVSLAAIIATASLLNIKVKEIGERIIPDNNRNTAYDTKQKIRDVAVLTALLSGGLATGMLLSKTTSEDIRGLLDRFSATELRDNLSEGLASLEDANRREVFKLIDIRNLSMALNTHIVQQTLNQSEELNRTILKRVNEADILFYAGGAHRSSKQNYLSGIDTLTDKIEIYTKDTISYSEKLITKSKNDKELQDNLNAWIMLTSSYSYPIATYNLNPEFQKAKRFNLPYSPRAIMWKELYNRYIAEPVKKTYHQMISRLAMEDYIFQHSTFGFGLNGTFYYSSPILEVAEMRRRSTLPGMPRLELPLPEIIISPESRYWRDSRFSGRFTLRISEGIPHIVRKQD